MSISNHLTLDALMSMPIGAIAALSASTLAQLQQEADEALRKAKALAAWLDGALVLKYADRARAARLDAEKNFGTVRFTDDGVTIVADLPKKVDWDQRELAMLVERIKAEGEDPREYVDIIVRVSERKFAAWPSQIRRAFEAARTVRAGAQSYRLTPSDTGDA
jgi:hypothetical protein